VFLVRLGRVRAQQIEVGFGAIGVMQVKSGVSEGDVIIIDGLDTVRDGDRVKTKSKPKS
jgi:hypothetical protein